MAFKPTFCIIILVVFLFAAGISDADDDDEYLRTDCSRLFWVGRPVLGIDLGTSYSRVGIFNRASVYDNGHVEIIADNQGNRATPSWVAFTGTGTLIGEAAKNQSASNPERTIFNVKRLIGRKFDDPQVQEDMKTLPYKVVNKDGRPYIEVKIRDGETKVFSPEEISAMILQKMKFIAESYLERDIQNAVITVPAYFNDSQRLATKIAGTIAGFNTVCVTNESSTASLDSYDLYDDLVNPDEAAASEAAIVGWSICEHGLGPSTLTLSGSSIGIETGGGIMKKLIQTHTSLPTRRSHVFSTYRDNQTTVLIKVYAGERALTRDCIELGSFELSGIPPAPRVVPQIEVSIEIDPYYMIQATAQDKATNKSISITLPKETIWLTIGFEALDKRREAVLFAVEDRDVKEKIKERNKLEAFDMMNSITDGGEFGDKKRIEDTDEGKMKEMENASRPIVKRVQENTVGSSLVIARTKSSLALYATNS